MTGFRNLTLLAALGASAAWAEVYSLHPLVAEDDPEAVSEPSLIGKWSYDVEITSDGDNTYRVKLEKEIGTLRLIRLNGLLLGDFRLRCDTGVPVHIFLKLRVEQNRFYVGFLNTTWLTEQIQALGWPRYEVLGEAEKHGEILLLASTEELRRIFVPYLCDDRAVEDDITLERVESAETATAKESQ
jgi:hypothetical protein